MKEENVFIKLFKKIKCLLGFHDYCKFPDGHVECWECGRREKLDVSF